jgi:hypothetical protein
VTRAYLRFSDRIMLAKCEVARRFPRSDKPSEPISRELERLATGDIIWKHRMPSLHRLASAGLVVFVTASGSPPTRAARWSTICSSCQAR